MIKENRSQRCLISFVDSSSPGFSTETNTDAREDGTPSLDVHQSLINTCSIGAVILERLACVVFDEIFW